MDPNRYARNEQGAGQWANDFGIEYGGGDVIDLPNGGGLIDILSNFKSGRNVGGTWTAAGGNGPNPNGAGSSSGGFSFGSSGGGMGGGAFGDMVRQTILDLIQGKGQGDINKQIAPQVEAFQRGQERNMSRGREEAAQRLLASGQGAVDGGSSGALESSIQGLRQQAGENTNRFTSQIMANELNNRREQLMQALQMGAGLLSEDQQLALRRELSNIDASLARERMGLEADQYQAGLNQRMVEMMLGGY